MNSTVTLNATNHIQEKVPESHQLIFTSIAGENSIKTAKHKHTNANEKGQISRDVLNKGSKSKIPFNDAIGV